ncbi:MAG: efflux RND transporter periplasmic adaptor subunit [Desulfobacterales bacterium]|nr:efflux RND transporter periplasmic adaptor subunit [Desulfobacterales bacterium]
MRMPVKKKIIIPISILLLLLLVLSLLFYYRSHKGPRELLLSGTVEVTEVEISPELSAKIVILHHREGDEVKEGDPLLDLDRSDLESRLREAEAAKRAAEAQVSLARARMENTGRDYNRNLQLYRAQAISASAYDAIKTAYEITKNTYEASQNQYKGAQSQVETVRVQLQKTHICSPITGVVLERSVEAGEVIFPGIVAMTIGELRSPWVRVYIGEPDIGKVRLGQKAFVVTDAYPKRQFFGTLRYIASEAEFTPKNVQTREERVKLVYEARVYLANEEGILKPGMPADVTLRLEE